MILVGIAGSALLKGIYPDAGTEFFAVIMDDLANRYHEKSSNFDVAFVSVLLECTCNTHTHTHKHPTRLSLAYEFINPDLPCNQHTRTRHARAGGEPLSTFRLLDASLRLRL